MNDAFHDRTFDAADFALYLRSRWRVVAICCISALLISGTVTLTLPKRFTATATLIIEPPAGMDPRSALAVSPVYLESLKTYENYASSDTLFSQALDKLGLRKRYPNHSIESLKHQVLDVTKPNNTRLIEIRATLPDPAEAKRLAQFVAEQTVALNNSLQQRSGEDAVQEAERAVDAAEARLRDALKAGTGIGAESVVALTTDLKNTSDLKYGVQSDLTRARTELADLIARKATFTAGDQAANWNAQEIAATNARVQDLADQEKKLEAGVAEEAALLERAKPAQDSLEAEQKLARADLESARAKLGELRSASAFRGERLEVLDPGIVPEKPSFPNLPFTVLVAFAVSLPASIVYLAAAFGFGRAVAARARSERVYSMR